MSLCLIFVCLLSRTVYSQIKVTETRPVFYQIAGIFEKSVVTQRLAFKESMLDAKLGQPRDPNAPSDSALKDWRLEPIILQPERSDSFCVWKDLCSNDTIRPVAVFGPQNDISDGTVRDQCALANIPHIQATWQPQEPDLDMIDEEETTEANEEPVYKKISINFYPPSEGISQAYAALLKHYGWENFAVLYEDNFGLLRIQKILAEYTTKFPVTVRKLDPYTSNFKVFKDLNSFKDNRIILDCLVDNIFKYIEEASAVKMFDEYQHYIFTSMDTSTIANKLSNFKPNITWFSLSEFEQLQDTKNMLAPRVGRWTSEKPSFVPPPVTDFKVEALMMNDVANHVLKALKELEADIDIEKPDSFLCESEPKPWPYGALFQKKILETKTTGVTGHIEFNDKGERANYTLYVNEINAYHNYKHSSLVFTKTTGVTGHIEFNDKGERANYTLYVNEINESTLDTIGKWDSATNGPIIEDRPISTKSSGYLKNSKKFIIISRKAEPYFYDKIKCKEDDENCTEETADEKFEGFSVDLVKDIFDTLRKYNFNYTYEFIDRDYEGYGKYDPETKKWGGLIGDLLDKKADLAVCDLTITEERKKVVDFSVPFMTLGISILYTKEKKVAPGMFSFLKPYTFDVWMYTATAYCVVSIVLFVCSRISPADWENPQPCDKDPEELENIWNFKNCAWLTMGSIMTQGCDILPKAIGTRWVCAMWWFFAVIVCQTYIAQLSASMTSALENEPINNVEDLSKQTKVLYGAIKSGSTLDFFKNSKDKMYRRMYENMKANPAVLVNSNDEGEKRVISGKNKYAFFMESTSIEYKLKRRCELKKVGEELDSKDYGIAMPANSPFRTHINRAILELKELTKLDKIKKKWWEEKNKAKHCEGDVDVNDAEGDLEMENLMGAFIVLIVGLVLSLFITAAEFMNEVRNIVVREQVTHKEVIIKELKASLNFFQMQKPVLRNPSRAPSLATSTDDSSDKKTKRSNITDNFLDFEKEPQ